MAHVLTKAVATVLLMAALLISVFSAAGQSNIGAVGIAMPDLVNRQSDRVIASRYLPATGHEELHAEVLKQTGFKLPKPENLRVAPVEVVQVLEQPVNLSEAVLANADNGYVLKCSISNNLGTPIIGLDYMLLVIDSNNSKPAILRGSEAFKLKGDATRNLVSKTTLAVNLGQGYRLILIPHRFFAPDSIWEVQKAADALEKFASGDYSITPRATRVTNLVDAPIGAKVIY